MTQSIQEYAELIRSHGYRLTPQREVIYGTLADADTHLTATEVVERVQAQSPSINKATVYRTLDFLHKMQLVTASDLGGQTVYEILEDVPHHHLVCRSCGHTQELDDRHFQMLSEHLLQEHRFKPEIHHLTISGLCATCWNGEEALPAAESPAGK